MSHRCAKCHAPRSPHTSIGAGWRCYACGEYNASDSAVRLKRKIGIHPALEKRYETHYDQDGLQQVVESHVAIDGAEAVFLPLIPGYELTKLVGSGAMGNVYRAIHLRSGREAAVKVLSKELAQRTDLVARFEREAAALRAFRHPNVVAIFDSGCYQGAHYYCMEFCHGVTLREELKKGALPPMIALQCMRQVLQGLAAAHERGIIHRDLKPENIMVEQGRLPLSAGFERVLLVDFGLADIVHEAQDPHPNLTHSRVTMGTVNYMAPEQHMDAKHVDHRTDLYACGVILYECLTGDLPIGRYMLPHERDKRLPLSLDTCLLRALNRNPLERFQSAVEFEDALKQVLDDLEKGITYHEQKVHIIAPDIMPVIEALPVMLEPPAQAVISEHHKKPKLVWGLLSLALGWVIGFIVASQPPSEIVMSTEQATPLYGGTTVKAGPVAVHFDSDSQATVSLATSSAEKSLVKWKGSSPVWQIEETRLAFLGNQGEMAHIRRDMSFLQPPDTLPEVTHLNLQLQLHIEKLSLPVKLAKAQYWAQEALGGGIDEQGGGLFLLQADGQKALGIMYLLGEGCVLAELHLQNGLMRPQHVQRTSCKINPKNAKLSLQCDALTQECRGYVDTKPVGKLAVPGMRSSDWKMALGCQNANCFFESSPLYAPKP